MWLVKDCTGLTFTAVVRTKQTLVIIVLGDLSVTYYGIYAFRRQEEFTTLGLVLMLSFQTCVSLSVLSYIRCIFTNPGATPRMEAPDIPLELLRFCEKCQQWKPPRTHHCSTCGICIHRVPSMQLDHHCPWVNNCVAVCTHKYFLLFILYFALAGVMGGGIMAYVGWDLSFGRRKYRLNILGVILGSFGGTCSMFFGLLGFALLGEQMAMVIWNQTSLDQRQKLQPKCVSATQASSLINTAQIFGRNYWAWLLPIAPDLDINFTEELQAVPPEPQKSQSTSLCHKAVLVLAIALGGAGLTGLTGLYLWGI